MCCSWQEVFYRVETDPDFKFKEWKNLSDVEKRVLKRGRSIKGKSDEELIKEAEITPIVRRVDQRPKMFIKMVDKKNRWIQARNRWLAKKAQLEKEREEAEARGEDVQ
jgi:hypothetical protein